MDRNHSPKTVISIGDLVADVIVQIPNLPVQAAQHQLARGISVEPGGAGNFLIAGARLGMRMQELGVIGDDLFGNAILAVLEREGVDTTGLVRQAGSTTTTVIVLADEMGRHVFLGKYGAGPDLAYPENWAGKIRNADAIFLSGYTLQESRLTAACLRALEAAREVGVPVFFDPGPEMVRAGSDLRERVLALSQVILMTEEEIPLMTGGSGGLEAVPGLLSMGAELACVKRGRDGCVLFRAGERVEHPGYPVEVRDTAAAGDSSMPR